MSDRFKVGDYVEPKPEWVGNANAVPSGVVRAIAPWGKDGALYVGTDRRAFAAFVFRRRRIEADAGLFAAVAAQ